MQKSTTGAIRKTPPRGTEPPFQRIESDLRARLGRGEWPKGTLMPSRRALAQEYSVALRTMERAVGNLLASGLLRAEGRWGTYVAGATDTVVQKMPPPSRLLSTQSAVIGLLDTISLSTHTPRLDVYGWLNVIATHAERALAHAGVTTRYFSSFGTEVEPVSVHQALLKLRQDGATALLVIGIYDEFERIREVLAAIDDIKLPTVYISWDDVTGGVPHVFYDNCIAGGQAAQHLLRQGYRHLVFFAPYTADWVEQRILGVQQTVSGTVRVFPEQRDAAEAERNTAVHLQCAFALLAECLPSVPSAQPTGIVAANDTLALLVLDAARELGLTAGRDFGLVGFDDQPVSRARGLTTLQPPLEALGKHAARMILDRLRGDETAMQTRLQSHLVPRESTQRVSNP